MRGMFGGVGTTRHFAWFVGHQGHGPWRLFRLSQHRAATAEEGIMHTVVFGTSCTFGSFHRGKTCRAAMRVGLLATCCPQRFVPPANNAGICRRVLLRAGASMIPVGRRGSDVV